MGKKNCGIHKVTHAQKKKKTHKNENDLKINYFSIDRVSDSKAQTFRNPVLPMNSNLKDIGLRL